MFALLLPVVHFHLQLHLCDFWPGDDRGRRPFFISTGNVVIEWMTDPVAGALIATGVVTLLVSFLACCGTLKGSPSMMKAYGVVMLLLVVVQIFGGVYILVIPGSVAIIGGGIIATAVLQLIAAIMSFCLASSFKKRQIEDMAATIARQGVAHKP
ncbi:uncharacterized protein LOC132202107 [Neocloeon triangulifer]|uniref:uncharacterized protein LOC132202107 n=1 Tax=Neocloeon triangulifer TaxID=2078957 RepID=UPI00286F325A|nr:uncharacterized protein LOC132202107 [Neocloeon triangulifer]